jgi:hypothetical protein
MPQVSVINKSSDLIECFVSKYTNLHDGSDAWYKLNAQGGGAGNPWARGSGWELVAFRSPDSGNNGPRAGVYINIEKGKTVEFHNYGNIVVY